MKKKVVMGVASVSIVVLLLASLLIFSKGNVVGEAVKFAGSMIKKPTAIDFPKTISRKDTSYTPELNKSRTGYVYTPIYYNKFYQGEREQFGYNPMFVPNTVTFSPDNRPYIMTHEGILQILNNDGTWHKVDLVAAAKYSFYLKMKTVPNWKDQWHGLNQWQSILPSGSLFLSGNQNDERVVFDSNGNAYTILHTADASNLNLHMLLYSKDQGLNWEVYPIPTTEWGADAKLEHQDGSNTLINPPGILVYKKWVDSGIIKSYLNYFDITKNTDGTLQLTKTVITDDSYLGAGASSFPNYMATFGNLTHFVYIGGQFQDIYGTILGIPPNPNYVRTYVKTYDHITKNLSPPVFVGAASGSTGPDDHEYPGICVDSKGIIHVIISGQRQLKYTHSLVPNDILSGWNDPVGIGEPFDESRPADASIDKGNYNYVELACDSNDTLHVISRSSGLGGNYKLVYMRKKAGQDWDTFPTSVPGENLYSTLKHKTLIYPWHYLYGNYYPKLNLDRKGRLFVNYIYYFDSLFSDEAAAYQQKWPSETLIKQDPSCVNNPIVLSDRTSAECPVVDCAQALLPDSGATQACRDTCSDHPCSYFPTVKAHDPGIIMSEDGGTTWRIATTRDFLSGMK